MPRHEEATVRVTTLDPSMVEDVIWMHASIFERDPAQARTEIEDERARPWSTVWVATAAARNVGYAIVWSVADEVQLLHIAVAPEARRKGVGAALLTRIVEGAEAASARVVLLEVEAENEPALALYRSHGFVVVNVRRAYYANGKDALEMQKVLERG
jgi:ribosomal-protein-alanine N-acetyltransferase